MTTTTARGRTAEERFGAATHLVWRRLPPSVRRWVPHTFLGFAAINGTTFALDLALLSVLYRGLGVPNPVAISVAYGVAFTLAFVLNRWLNFRAHGPVTGQAGRYVVVVALNYTVLILGVSSGLIALGVPFLLARLAAGLAEAIWMYVAMRWWVFAAG